jgi:hypothetical protein
MTHKKEVNEIQITNAFSVLHGRWGKTAASLHFHFEMNGS